MQKRQKQTIQMIVLIFALTNYIFWVYAGTFYGNFTRWLFQVYSGTGMTGGTLLLLSNIMGICLLSCYYWTETKKVKPHYETILG